jgi:hypothetical protein
MKKSILIVIILFTFCNVNAQTLDNKAISDGQKFVYCEMIGTQKFLSTKVTITIDFGEEMNMWKDNRVKDEVTGKAQSFNSMVDALNYMGQQGWDFAQAYTVTVGQQNVYHWLLKKKISE